MTLSVADIERIVQEVVRRVRTAAPAGGARSSSAEAGASPDAAQMRTASSPESPSDPSTSRRLVIQQRVVTYELLRDRLADVDQVVVADTAVVTPLVRDELRQRGIALAIGLTEEESVRAASRRMVLGVCTNDDQGLRRELESNGVAIERTTSGLPERVVEDLASQLSATPCPALLVSCRPAAAACLANRNPALRAFWATSPAAVAEAVATLAPNVLILDPSSEHRSEMIDSFLESWDRPNAAIWPSLLNAGRGSSGTPRSRTSQAS